MEINKKTQMWMDDVKHVGFRKKTNQERGSTSYRNDTRNIILKSYYGKAFEDVRNSGDTSLIEKKLEGKVLRGQQKQIREDEKQIAELKGQKYDAGKHSVVPYDLKPAFSLVGAGFTPMTIMGKEWDRQWAFHNEKRLIENAGINSDILTTEHVWINRAKNENPTTVKDFYNLLVADRLTKNPELMQNLATKEELEKAGYKVSEMATPIFRGTKANGGYYDLSACYKDGSSAYFYNAPVFADENLVLDGKNSKRVQQAVSTQEFFEWAAEHEKTGISFEDFKKNQPVKNFSATLDIHSMNLDVAKSQESFNDFVRNVERATGAKIVADANIDSETKVYAEKNILRSVGRKFVNFYRVKFNKRSNLLKDSYKIHYSKNMTREEQVYAILSQVANISTTPFIERTEKIVGEKRGYRLPTKTEFGLMKGALSKFTTAMTTAELAKIILTNPEDAAKIEGLSYLKASQTLASAPELADNKHFIPLSSGYVASAVNRCGAAMGQTLEDYEKMTGKKPSTKNNSFLGSVFAKLDYSLVQPLFKTSGVIETEQTEEEKIEQTANQFKYLDNLAKKLEEEGKTEFEVAKAIQFYKDVLDEYSNTDKSIDQIYDEMAVSKAMSYYGKVLDEYSKTNKSIDQVNEEMALDKQYDEYYDNKQYAEYLDRKKEIEEINKKYSKDKVIEKIKAASKSAQKLKEKLDSKQAEAEVETEKVEEVQTQSTGILEKEEETKKEETTAIVERVKAKRIHPWGKWLEVFKQGKEGYDALSAREQRQFKEDIQGLGGTPSLKKGVMTEVVDMFNTYKITSFTKEEQEAFMEAKHTLPVGELVNANKLRKASKQNEKISEIDKITNSTVSEILEIAASDKKYEKMTGADVVKEHFSINDNLSTFVKKIVSVFKTQTNVGPGFTMSN